MLKQFKTLAELMVTFSDNQAALDHFKATRWRNGEFCPYCGHDKVYSMQKGNRYACAQCKNTFSILVGTIFENTKLPLKVWFGAIWMLANHPKGIASTTMARDLGVTQKTAWFVLHRLRYAAHTKSFNKPLTGVVEIDETFVGGKARNLHGRRRGRGSGRPHKPSVIGAVQRKGDVVAKVVPAGIGWPEAQQFIDAVVSKDVKILVTDGGAPYMGTVGFPQHQIVNHAKGEYLKGDAHTNTIEGVWAQLKRQINGTHHWVSTKHLQQYVSEMAWRLNRRDMTAQERVNALFSAVEGRLTYKALIA
jgi:transposase-like protein